MNVESLYRLHAVALMRYLARLTGDPDVAADAVQETFVRYMQAPPRSPDARAWLFTVGTNLVREQGRSTTRRTGLLERMDVSQIHAARHPEPAAHVEALERRLIVRNALDRLIERDRVALLMREEGFSHAEIAEAIGTTTKSVGTIIVRALRKLAAELPQDGSDLP